MENNKFYTLENNFLKATFKTSGAELTSLICNDIEYIWDADPKHWNRHTPVLFPFVGAEKDNSYLYKGIEYKIGQHGFARDQSFSVINYNSSEIIFELTESNESKKIYPFNFILQIKYTLNHKNLTTEYIVKNPSSTEIMYFSIGAHPAFKCPFNPEHTREEYNIVFDTESSPKSQLLKNGLRTNDYFTVFNTQKGVLNLPKNIFDKDALVFNPNPFSKATFVHKESNKEFMSVIFKGFPYLGIWSKSKDSPFICIEPWHGIADHVNHNKELTKKEGIIKLETCKTFSCEYVISIP